MIRINLLGQARPKAAKKAVPLEATVQVIFFIVAIGIAVVVLGSYYYSEKRDLDATNTKIAALRAERTSLQQVKADVTQFEQQKQTLQTRIDVIEQLQKNRTGAQELLQQVANTVVRVDELWLTSLTQTQNAIQIEGDAGSINAVANFLTQLQRSGYFDKIEIKEAKENDVAKGVETFGFSITANIAQPGGAQGQAQAKTAGATASPKNPAQTRGRS
ncbi:MAG TPA: PilN domain-containing protein [Verrucomicrobiae bacterium]|nr:PilN domain-containing protein [Verrucomicrobiae bacterium]